MLDKVEIRKKCLSKRLNMQDSLIKRLSNDICQLIKTFDLFKDANVIALYYPVKSEVDIFPLTSERGKTFVFPKVVGEKLEFAQAISSTDFIPGTLGIPEPTNTNNIDINYIEIMAIPGVAFDLFGYRLGYGKGFYDRLLGEYPHMVTIGVCYDEFLFESLKADPWDSRVDYIVTQNGIFKTDKEVARCH